MTATKEISGATRVAFMIGRPVTQVRSPALFNAWAAKTAADVVMVTLDLLPDGVGPFFELLRKVENAIGAVVTVPHKQAAFRHLDQAGPSAALVEACNVVRREPDGRLVGIMTDGLGYVAALRANGVRLEGASLLLVGAGGAGSAIACEAAQSGVARLVVIDLDVGRRDRLLRRLAASFPALECLTEVPAGGAVDIVCNATPLGMAGDARLPFPLERLPPSTVVTDVVTDPALTPWLQAARARGMRIQTGQEMVRGQFDLIVSHLLRQ